MSHNQFKVGDKIISKQSPAWNGSTVTKVDGGKIYATGPRGGVGLFFIDEGLYVAPESGKDRRAPAPITAKMTLAVLNHLKTVGTVSNMEAQGMFKCRALPKRISELKSAGYIITSKLGVDSTGQRYKRYFFARSQRAGPAYGL